MLLSAGHTGVMGYGLAWYEIALKAADRAERRRRLALVTDVLLAVRGEKDALGKHLKQLSRD
ncbi:MAG: hypothetical protein RDU30_09915 [Desulfovibrionaceae bacterium]|nr:hypothetical protein [Desulfovibrionaceae bacterium]